MFRIFFIISLVSETWYIPPKREPDGKGRNPMIVITTNNPTENKFIDLIFAGSWKISAISTSRAAIISSNSWRISKKFVKLILSIYAESFPVIIKKD